MVLLEGVNSRMIAMVEAMRHIIQHSRCTEVCSLCFRQRKVIVEKRNGEAVMPVRTAAKLWAWA